MQVILVFLATGMLAAFVGGLWCGWWWCRWELRDAERAAWDALARRDREAQR